MNKTKRVIFTAFCTLFASNSFALHANKKEHRLSEGDRTSKAIVKLIIGDSACSGSFLSQRTILTAAHCVPKWGKGENLTVITYDGSNPKQILNINWSKALMTPHPDYDFEKAANDLSLIKSDIAVITLDSPIKEAQPVKLFDSISRTKTFDEYVESTLNKSYYLVGNGSRQRLRTNGILAAVDQIRSLTKQTTATLSNYNELTLEFKTSKGTKVCQGDSGGPALLKDSKGEVYQLGVVSIGYTGILWAKNCGSRVFYAAIGESNLDWVLETKNLQESL